MKTKNGYTVIEILVVVAILSIVFTALVTLLIQQQRQFGLTTQGVDVDQTGRSALDYIATEIRNAGARQGKNTAFDFVNGGSDSDPLCSTRTTKTGTAAPPDCLTLFTWDITEGFSNDEILSTAEPGDGTLVGSSIVIDVDGWYPDPTLIGTDPQLISSNHLIGFWSRGSLCNEVTGTCLNNPQDCTECAAILRVDSLSDASKQATVSGVNSIISQNFQTSDFSSMAAFFNNFFLPKIVALSSEMTLVQSKTFAIDDTTLLMDENISGTFQPIAGGLLDPNDPDSVQIAPGIVDLQFVFNLQDSDGGITRVGMPTVDDEDTRQFVDFTVATSTPGLSYNSDMRGRQRDTRTVEIYLVVRSRLKPQLLSGETIPVQEIPQLGDVTLRDTDDASLGDGFIYKVFNTMVYLRNLAREELG